MAKVKRSAARSAKKFEHGINIGLLLFVIVVVLLLGVLVTYTLMNQPQSAADDAKSTVTNYSTYEMDQTLK